MSKFDSAVKSLAAVRDEVNDIFSGPEDEHIRLRIGSAIQRQIDYLSMMGNTSGTELQKTTILGPATTIGGKKLTEISKGVKKEELQPDKTEIDLLRERVEQVYTEFPDMATADIIDSLDVKVILGVAKKAKVPKVTAETKVTADLVEQIKEAISKKAK